MAEQTYNENGNGVKVISGPAIIEKEKFIIVCGGRGLGKHNNGRNFLNAAKYHIEDIKMNRYPGLPKFDPMTCEIVTPDDLYKKIGYLKHIDPQRPNAWQMDENDEYYIDNQNRRIAQDNQDNWYVLNPRDLNSFTSPLISSSPAIKKDTLFMKTVESGEIHRVSDFKKIFSLYKNIKYLAFFGHGWAGAYDGAIFIGDRAAEDTNLFYSDLNGLDISNVLLDAQVRVFSCRSGFKVQNFFSAAEMFAKALPGRKSYGWGASGGSIFTHDENYGYTGINKTGRNPNTEKVDTNKRKAWLVANGKPEGWVEYVF